jgi:hypothetical protein
MFTNATYKIILPIKGEDRNKYNYVYQITELSTGMKYIGSRGCKIDDVYKDLKKYKSSTTNKCFKISQKLNPLNYHYEILSYHTTREEANLAEGELHDLYDVKVNLSFYNKTNRTENGFGASGKTCVKDKYGNAFLVNCDDPRFLSGELISTTKGKVCVKDKFGNSFHVDKNDARLITGEVESFTKGKTVVKDKNGNMSQVDCNDPRFLSGELISIHKNKSCFLNKDGSTLYLDIDDERIKSECLIHVNKRKSIRKDKNGNIIRLDKNDPRIINEGLESVHKGMVLCKDKSGNTLYIHKTDERFLSGELSGINIGKTSVKDRSGNTFMADKNDERLITGELIGATGRWISVDGEIYSNRILQEKYNLSYGQVSKRCKSDKWPNWNYV